jgi:hypothetical protein
VTPFGPTLPASGIAPRSNLPSCGTSTASCAASESAQVERRIWARNTAAGRGY